MKQLSRPQWIALGVSAAVVLGAGVTLAVAGGGDGDAEENPVAQPGIEEATAVATALAGLADDPAALVAADVRSAVGSQARKAVPKGSTVSPNEASWKPDGLGGGTMTVTVAGPGQQPVTYSAIMVKEETGWKVAGTIPLIPTDAGSFPADGEQAPAARPPGVAPAPQPGTVAPAAGAGTIPQPQGTQPQGGQQPGGQQPGTQQPDAQQPGAAGQQGGGGQ